MGCINIKTYETAHTINQDYQRHKVKTQAQHKIKTQGKALLAWGLLVFLSLSLGFYFAFRLSVVGTLEFVHCG